LESKRPAGVVLSWYHLDDAGSLIASYLCQEDELYSSK